MDEIRVTQAPAMNTTSVGGSSSKAREREASPSGLSRVKRGCASFSISFQEGFRYLKATLIGQAKKMTARDEKDATKANLMTSKMQVDAADAAEDAKKKINKSA